MLTAVTSTLIATFLPLAGDGVLEWVTAGMRSRLAYPLGVP
ncbi:MAG: hypothetical protein VKL39_05295 [Leptolyngbyaceae bacterium]|nr:hypothetical protein [Leptolyngbyaceae bacterium]